MCLQYGAHSLGELSSYNCQKGLSIIRLRYPVHGTVLAGTGFEKNGRISGQPEPDIRYIPNFGACNFHVLACWTK